MCGTRLHDSPCHKIQFRSLFQAFPGIQVNIHTCETKTGSERRLWAAQANVRRRPAGHSPVAGCSFALVSQLGVTVDLLTCENTAVTSLSRSTLGTRGRVLTHLLCADQLLPVLVLAGSLGSRSRASVSPCFCFCFNVVGRLSLRSWMLIHSATCRQASYRSHLVQLNMLTWSTPREHGGAAETQQPC